MKRRLIRPKGALVDSNAKSYYHIKTLGTRVALLDRLMYRNFSNIIRSRTEVVFLSRKSVFYSKKYGRRESVTFSYKVSRHCMKSILQAIRGRTTFYVVCCLPTRVAAYIPYFIPRFCIRYKEIKRMEKSSIAMI